MSGDDQTTLGGCAVVPAPPSAEDSMAESIVMLLMRLAEVEAERDFYKAAAGKLMKPCKGGGQN